MTTIEIGQVFQAFIHIINGIIYSIQNNTLIFWHFKRNVTTLFTQTVTYLFDQLNESGWKHSFSRWISLNDSLLEKKKKKHVKNGAFINEIQSQKRYLSKLSN